MQRADGSLVRVVPYQNGIVQRNGKHIALDFFTIFFGTVVIVADFLY